MVMIYNQMMISAAHTAEGIVEIDAAWLPHIQPSFWSDWTGIQYNQKFICHK